MFFCDLCGQGFSDSCLLEQHRRYDHQIWNSDDSDEGDQSVKDGKEEVSQAPTENLKLVTNNQEATADNSQNQPPPTLGAPPDNEEETDHDPVKDIDFVALYKKRDYHARKFERLYKSKLSECKEHLERILLFEKQFDEFKTKFNDANFNEFSSEILSSTKVRDYLELRKLMDLKSYGSIVRSTRLVKALKSLFIGLKYGVVPLVIFQKKRLNNKSRSLIKLVDRKSVEEIKRLVLKYSKEFYNIFQVIGRTLAHIASLEYA